MFPRLSGARLRARLRPVIRALAAVLIVALVASLAEAVPAAQAAAAPTPIDPRDVAVLPSAPPVSPPPAAPARGGFEPLSRADGLGGSHFDP